MQKIRDQDIISIANNRDLIICLFKNGNYKIYNTLNKKITNTKNNDKKALINIMLNNLYK